jgi:hypothetical protein
MLSDIASGECRWIGRHDLHVYCHAPAGREPRYCVVCPDEGLEYLPYAEWLPEAEAAAIVDRITTKGEGR